MSICFNKELYQKKKKKKSIPHSYARRSRFAWTLYRKESGSFDVTRDDSERRFLAQHRVLQCWNNIVTIRNNVAKLCCAKNRRCESSRVITLAMAIIKAIGLLKQDNKFAPASP